MDWTDVEAKLCERVEEVARKLLPNGRRIGGEWVVGNIDGREGQSLKVNLTGKIGVWRDFGKDDPRGGKSLMELWKQVRGVEFKVAIAEAEEFLGMRDDFHERVKSYRRAEGLPPKTQGEDSAWRAVAEVWAKCQPLTQGGPVWNYLVGERKIEPLTLDWFNVREMISHGRWVMVFPYYLPPDASVAAETLMQLQPQLDVPAWLKFEALERRAGKKVEWTTRAPEKCLWGVRCATHPAFKKCEHVLICEGEKDALSWASARCSEVGVLPTSVPFGAKWRGQVPGQPSPNREWLDRCWKWLNQFETVYLAMDSDEAGQRAAADIIFEVGPRRCRLIDLPNKRQMEEQK
jgi:twinkle protein